MCGLGAAIQGAVLTGETKDIVSWTHPLTLGIETLGGIATNHRAKHNHPHPEKPDLLHGS